MQGTTSKFETPFTTAALNNDADFWRSYIAGRPSPTEDFFNLIQKYHADHGDTRTGVAHDVGTGPGNIAEKLLRHYDQVVGSDVNGQALDAARVLIPPENLERMHFFKAPAEELATGSTIPESVGRGNTDLVLVSECMPLLDAPRALKAFHTLLRPGGTLAIYFYSRPIFTDGDSATCNDLYDRVATRICKFLLPFKGTPGFPFHSRAAEVLCSYMDNIAMPAQDWEHVERLKWNCDYPLLFNSKEGYDFDFAPVDRRTDTEVTKEVIDREFWAEDWDIHRVASYLASVFPNYRAKAGGNYSEVESLLEDLQRAMGGGKTTRKVAFNAVLILATKK